MILADDADHFATSVIVGCTIVIQNRPQAIHINSLYILARLEIPSLHVTPAMETQCSQTLTPSSAKICLLLCSTLRSQSNERSPFFRRPLEPTQMHSF